MTDSSLLKTIHFLARRSEKFARHRVLSMGIAFIPESKAVLCCFRQLTPVQCVNKINPHKHLMNFLCIGAHFSCIQLSLSSGECGDDFNISSSCEEK